MNARPRLGVYFVAILFALTTRLPAATFLTAYGDYKVAGTEWTLSISAHQLELSAHTRWDHAPDPNHPGQTFDGESAMIVDSKWSSHTGWFVAVDNRKIWAFNGDKNLMIQVVPPPGQPYKAVEKLIIPPDDVLDRLPAKMAAKIRALK
jgi:hypothetical protein